jgi:hypothetical protein
VKGLAKLQIFYGSDHPRYRQVYVGVTCFATADAALGAGYQEAPAGSP